MKHALDINHYIVHDFFRELKENEHVISYPHFRAVVVTDETNVVVFNAILEKPKGKKNWKYILDWSGNFPPIDIKQYVTPFRATEKNRQSFNRKSKLVARKLIEKIEEQTNSQHK